MVFMTLSTSLLLQKIVRAACYVGETIFGCKLLVFRDEYGGLLSDTTS